MDKSRKESIILFMFGVISNIFVAVFGQIIPNAVSGFFRDIGAAFILVIVFAFAFTWFLKARPHNKPKRYHVITFDVYGQEVQIDGMRTEFRNHDVAWSFMKQYKVSYPMHNFAMVADAKNSEKKTIFRYI